MVIIDSSGAKYVSAQNLEDCKIILIFATSCDMVDLLEFK